MFTLSSQITNAINKAKQNIKLLCETVNVLDKKSGGNGRKVRVDDFSEHLNRLQCIADDLQGENQRFANIENLYLVVFHPQGYEPSSTVVNAPDAQQAWQGAIKEYDNAVGKNDDELFLDHVKLLSALIVK